MCVNTSMFSRLYVKQGCYMAEHPINVIIGTEWLVGNIDTRRRSWIKRWTSYIGIRLNKSSSSLNLFLNGNL